MAAVSEPDRARVCGEHWPVDGLAVRHLDQASAVSSIMRERYFATHTLHTHADTHSLCVAFSVRFRSFEVPRQHAPAARLTAYGIEIFCCELQTPVGNLSTDAVIRAQFAGIPKQAAQQEFVVMAVTDALFQMGWSEGSSTATMVETVPIV